MNKRLVQISVDFIVDTEMPDSKIHALVSSSMRSTLLKIVKARMGITEVKHTLTDKGPMYVPISELKEKEDGKGTDGGTTGFQGDTKEGDGRTGQA